MAVRPAPAPTPSRAPHSPSLAWYAWWLGGGGGSSPRTQQQQQHQLLQQQQQHSHPNPGREARAPLPLSPAPPLAKRHVAASGVAALMLLVAFPLYFLATCHNTHHICSRFASISLATASLQRGHQAEKGEFLPLPSPSLRSTGPGNGSHDPFDPGLIPERLQNLLQMPWRGPGQRLTPVVLMHAHGGALPCARSHYIVRVLRQARRHNEVVHFLGPEECSALASDLDIRFTPFSEYQDVVEWFQDRIGYPVFSHLRWYVLRAFLQRNAYPRAFYMDTDVLLFANMSDFTAKFLRREHVCLSVRWPNLRSPSPSQYASITVSGHVALWTYPALCDFLDFHLLFFKEAVLFGERGDKSLVPRPEYSDTVILGWYTFKICWVKRPEDLHPQCISDRVSGVTPERSVRIRDKFVPKYRVASFAAPRWCQKTEYVDRGWCVMDHGFSVQSPRQLFKFWPDEGMKTPVSMHYSYFEDWSKGQEPQTSRVQFLSVHFLAHKKGYLVRGDDPATTWGANAD